jgi:hypothetical protein
LQSKLPACRWVHLDRSTTSWVVQGDLQQWIFLFENRLHLELCAQASSGARMFPHIDKGPWVSRFQATQLDARFVYHIH